MKALVLSGGKGTRLRPITYTGAKQLVPVANKPILFYVIENIADLGIKDIGIVISPDSGPAIKEALGNGDLWGLKITYIVQDQPSGLAHAVKTAKNFLKESPFLMYLGDNLIGTSINKFYDNFIKNGADAQILLKPVENPSAFGIATIDDNGKVIRLEEKPKNPVSNLALVGVYLFSSKIHKAIDQVKPSWRGELEITDSIQVLLDDGCKVHSNVVEEWWLDTGKKDDLLQANTIVLDELIKRDVKGKINEDSTVVGRVVLAKTSKVINSRVRGPVIIGEGVEIVNSFIGPFSSIGENVQIHNSSVENCVVLNGSKIVDVERLEDSILGKHSKILKTNKNSHQVLRLLVGDDSVIEI